MADDTEASEPAEVATPKKTKTKSKKSKASQTHPKVSEMVTEAITELKERGGSSLQAIKKYIGSNFKVDVEKLSPFVKKYLKSAVANGSLLQTKGHGATGSFKLNVATSNERPRSREEPKKKSKPAAKKAPAKAKKVEKKAKVKVEKKTKAAKSPKKPKAKPAARPKASKAKKKSPKKGKKAKK